MFLLAPILGFLKAVPWWAYGLAAILMWGGWQKHRATVAAKELAEQAQVIEHNKEAALTAALAETSRRLTKQTKVIQDAEQAKVKAIGDAASAAATVDGLRSDLAAYAARGRASDSAASAASKTDRIADLLGRCAERYRTVAAEADRAVIAGAACEQSYLSLTKETP
jgi:hypothetical protein